MDAVRIGERVYHASCHAEAKRDGGSTPMNHRGTPEPVLGKRKAEVSFNTPQKKHIFFHLGSVLLTLLLLGRSRFLKKN